MKLKLIKCLICDHWRLYKVSDNHCAVCGAIKLSIGGKIIHVNRAGKEMARGISHYHFKANILSIAQTINEKEN